MTCRFCCCAHCKNLLLLEFSMSDRITSAPKAPHPFAARMEESFLIRLSKSTVQEATKSAFYMVFANALIDLQKAFRSCRIKLR